MRYFLILIFVWTIPTFVSGQDIIDSLYSGEKESEEVLNRHVLASNFSQTLHKVGDPSIGSFALSDFNYNSSPSKQKKPFILNANIQPIINIGGKRWYIKDYVHNFQVIPSVAIRIFENDPKQKDHSLPVRTPGFMLKFNYFFSHAKLWNDSLKNKIYFCMSMFHHSNGQDGYEFNKNDSIVNTYNGNFSEIVVGELIIGGMRSIERACPEDKKLTRVRGRKIQLDSRDGSLFWKLGYEKHPKIATSPRFYEHHLYGKNRINLQLGYLFNPASRHLAYSSSKKKWMPLENTFQRREVRRIVFNASYIFDAVYNTGAIDHLEKVNFFQASKRLNTDITWYERVGTTNDFALFFRVGYYGSDPYNIYFQESLFVARMGIAFGTFTSGERK